MTFWYSLGPILYYIYVYCFQNSWLPFIQCISMCKAMYWLSVRPVVKVASSSRGLRGRRRRYGWGIWHVLCMKEHFFINSRGLKPEHGSWAPWPLTLTTVPLWWKQMVFLNWYWLLISRHFLSHKRKFYFNVDKASWVLRPQTPYRGSAPGPCWGSPVPQPWK